MANVTFKTSGLAAQRAALRSKRKKAMEKSSSTPQDTFKEHKPIAVLEPANPRTVLGQPLSQVKTGEGSTLIGEQDENLKVVTVDDK